MKAIKNQAKINESPSEKLIRELKEEIERLRDGGGGGGGGAGGVTNDAELQRKMAEQDEMMKEI